MDYFHMVHKNIKISILPADAHVHTGPKPYNTHSVPLLF